MPTTKRKRSSTVDDIPPSTGGYVKGNPLGQGFFGVVALFRKEGILFAGKKVRDDKMFQNEVAVMFAASSCPYVVQCRHVDYLAQVFVMDYCAGGDLFDLVLAKYGDLHKQMRQIAMAVQSLQGQHIVHRDLKPENIFVQKNGDVLVGDFGLSILLDDKDDRMTNKNGTSAYQAPEIWDCDDYGRTVDLWSVGVLFFIMEMGNHPYDLEGTASKSEVRRLIGTTAVPTTENAALDEVVAGLTQRDPGKRWDLNRVLSAPFFSG